MIYDQRLILIRYDVTHTINMPLAMPCHAMPCHAMTHTHKNGEERICTIIIIIMTVD